MSLKLVSEGISRENLLNEEETLSIWTPQSHGLAGQMWSEDERREPADYWGSSLCLG